MKKFAFVGVLSLLMVSCSKQKHDFIYGVVSVKGKILDFVSNQPVANCKVTLLNVSFRRVGELSGAHRVQEGAIQSTVTDSTGSYSLTVNATGQYEFDLFAEPTDPLHVNSFWTFGQDYTIKEAGDHTEDLKCRRSAYARVEFKNVSPIDTAYALSLYSYANITLHNFYKDTTVYLKLVGNSEQKSNVRFTGTNKSEQQFNLAAGPWDTIPLQINY